MRQWFASSPAMRSSTPVLLSVALLVFATVPHAQPVEHAADALLAIDQQRESVVDRIVATWGAALAKSSEPVSIDDLRTRLMQLRADRLLAASLSGTEEGVRAASGFAAVTTKPTTVHTKALGDIATDVVYTPVTPCRLVETRGTFAAVYQGNGTPSHTPVPFAPNEIRSYAVQGGNGVCLAQLPAGLNPSAVQLQVFGMPTTGASGDIEILPQGATFGSTATMVYVGAIAFNTVSTAARVNTSNHQIGVQVRGGGANVAIDVVGYFSAPSGNAGKFFMQGGNAFGTTARLGTLDGQPFELDVDNQRALRIESGVTSPNWLAGYANNGVYPSLSGVTIGGGGAPGVRNDFILPGNSLGDECWRQYGCINGVLDAFGTIAGGAGNLAGAGTMGVQGQAASVGGGVSNWAYAAYSAVAGGNGNTASGYGSAVLGGSLNSATNLYAVALGGNGNHANGLGSVTVGGLLNTADSANSLAAGTHAIATAVGEFVWSDYAENGAPFDPSVAPPYGWGANPGNTFNVRATGGVWLVTAVDGLGRPTWGCTFTSGSGPFCSSDRNLKRNLVELDGTDVLARLDAMPIYAWQPKDGPNASDRHIGPMAQDFYATFGLGHTDTAIGLQDEAGVALAAIRGLRRIIEAKFARIDALERRLDEQQRIVEEGRRSMQSQQEAIANMQRTVERALARGAVPVLAKTADRFEQ
jgi:hypothetical protein